MPTEITEIDLSTADRGNVIPDAPDDEPLGAPATPAEPSDEAEAAAAEAAASEAAAAEAAEKTEAPRDASGKFAKKEKDDAADGPKVVPKARFDEQVGRERAAREAAERHAAELAERLREKGINTDIDTMVKEVRSIRRLQEEALFAGDKAKAAELADKADDLNRDIGEQKALIKAQAAQQAAEGRNETERTTAIIDQLEAEHPEFQDGHELYNQRLVNFTLAEQARLIAEERMSPSKALLKAAKDTLELFGERAKPAASAPEKGGLGAGQAADRKAAQVAKNIATAGKQPGNMKELGQDSDKAGTNKVANEDAAKMSYEEFSALPESAKSKLRGDTI